MAKSTTHHGEVPLVVGAPHEQPAVRRLARACIALIRWQRNTNTAATSDSTASAVSTTAEGCHD